jgi:hypothetical protein
MPCSQSVVGRVFVGAVVEVKCWGDALGGKVFREST